MMISSSRSADVLRVVIVGLVVVQALLQIVLIVYSAFDKRLEVVKRTIFSEVDSPIFVKSAYRVFDDQVRIGLVKSVNQENINMYYSFNGFDWNTLNVECLRVGECPRRFSPSCVFTGFVGSIIVKDKKSAIQNVYLAHQNNVVKIDVMDVRVYDPPIFEHSLGVCVQPLFMAVDWPQLVQFFEYWLSEGSTMFLIYVESISRQLMDVIQFYQISNSRVHIELIAWSRFRKSLGALLNSTNTIPQDQHSTSYHPDNLNYRLEPEMAIWDCMHRAKSRVQFMAQSDLDEIFQTNGRNGLLRYLRFLYDKQPDAASFNFQSQRVRIPDYWSRIHSLRDFNFSPFYEAELESEVFPRNYYSKNIYIPSRVKSYDIHFLLDVETSDSLHPRNFTHINVPKSSAQVLHFRKVVDIFPWKSFKRTGELNPVASKLDVQFFRRTLNDKWNMTNKWLPNYSTVVLGVVERCRRNAYNRRKEQCHSLEQCYNEVWRGLKLDWIVSSNSWFTL